MAATNADEATDVDVESCNWLPLESNPDVLNPFVKRLGCPDGWGFADVFGLDEELLMMVPQPCVALCLLFPSPNISPVRRQERSEAFLKTDQQMPEGVYFLQQHDNIGNACGTIASIHAVMNASAQGHFDITPGSILETFRTKTLPMDPAERGWELTRTKEVQEMSDETAAAGETEGAGTDDANDSHFISFVNIGGMLYELDGRMRTPDNKAFPIAHGPTTAESFVSDAAKVIREDFMARDPENMNFVVTALCKLD